MRSWRILFILGVIYCSGTSAWSQVNDNCNNAIPVAVGFNPFNTTAATTDGLPINDLDCPDLLGTDDQIYNDVWFVFVSPATDLITISTCGTADFDTRLAVYEVAACPPNSADVLACADDSPGCPNFTSTLTFPADAGAQYLIRVGGFEPTAAGGGELVIDVGPVCNPPVAQFEVFPNIGTVPFTPNINNLTIGTEPLNYFWDFDADGAPDSTDPNPVFTYTQPGIYDLILFVDGPCGSDTAVQIVEVLPPATATMTVESNYDNVPMTLSPADENGDGDGATPLNRVYLQGSTVTVTAPATHMGNAFLRWEIDGQQQPHGDTSVDVPVNADVTVRAVYQEKITDCKELIKLMVSILCDCFGDLAAPQTTAGVKLGPGGEDIVKCLKKLTDRWHPNNIAKKAMGANTNAHVDGDSTANCTDQDLIYLNEDKFPSSDCDKNFAWYLGTLYHEATHSLQNWTGFGTRGERFKAQIELPANMNDKAVNTAVKAAIEKILENRNDGDPDTDGLDPCFKHFTNQRTSELEAMRDELTSQIANDCRKVTRYSGTLGVTVSFVGPPLFDLAEELYAAALSDATREDFPILVTGGLQSSDLSQEDLGNGSLGLLSTGIARILDLEILRDNLGNERLLVFGTTEGYNLGALDSGIIKSYADTDNDGFFDQASETTLIAGQAGFQSASNLTTDPATLTTYVYDSITRKLRPFTDTDFDSIPDSLGSNILGEFPLELAQMGIVQFSLDRLEARMRFGDMAGGNEPIVVFSDTNLDGFYETAVRSNPALLNDRDPSVCTFPFVGNTSMGIAGQAGHTLRVDEVTEAGVFLQTLDTVSIPTNTTMGLVNFGAPLTAGQFLQIEDLDSGVIIGPFPTRTPEPFVYHADITEGPLSGGTVVTYTGDFLSTVTGVTYDGNPGVVNVVSATTVEVTTPAAALEGYSFVEFTTSVSAPFAVTPFVYVPAPPVQPTGDAGSDQTVVLSGASVSVMLDGSGSSDNGGDPLLDYVWTGNFEGGIAFGPNPSVTFDALGTYVVVLMVSSGEAHSDPVSVQIAVVPPMGSTQFVRGDCNGDGNYNIADAIFELSFLFGGPGVSLACADACDCNDDGMIDIGDAICTLSGLFGLVTVPPVAPHPSCGVDPTMGDALDCASYPACP